MTEFFETSGCITISGKLINENSLETNIINNKVIVEIEDYTDPSQDDYYNHYSEVDVKPISYPIDIQIDDISSSIEIDISHVSSTSISCGIVCGAGIGLPVLYASDGVLITIDGKFLIVQPST